MPRQQDLHRIADAIVRQYRMLGDEISAATCRGSAGGDQLAGSLARVGRDVAVAVDG